MDVLLATGAAGCYALAALCGILGLTAARPPAGRMAATWMGIGALLLCVVLVLRGVAASCVPVFSRFDALACYVVAVTVVYLATATAGASRRIEGLIAPYLLLALLCGLPAIEGRTNAQPPLQNGWLGLHILLAYAGYAFLTLAGLMAAAYLVQDDNLKHKRLGLLWERLPALETLDHWMGRLVGKGFLLLTGSILLGILLVRRSGGDEQWLTDPKVGATAATWILFAVLVHMRASIGRHGRMMALVTIAGLGCLLFTFVGVHLVADSLHGFVRILPGY